MVDQFVAELQRVVSSPRLERYRKEGDIDLDMVTNYYWNMALADALLCPLGTVEIMLRNTVHNTLSHFFGRADWYDGRGLLEEKQEEQVTEAKAHIASRNKPLTPERIVSSLTFGFWVTLLSGNYNDRSWRPNKSANLRAAFPHTPKNKRKRSDIQNKYYRVLSLRNLAFPHEPILDLQNRLDDHRRAYEGIEWIDPSMVAKRRLFDRFLDTHQNGRAAVETKLKTHLGL